MPLRYQAVFSADFFGMTLVALLFLLPPRHCFLRVPLPTLFAAVLRFCYYLQPLQLLAQQFPTIQHLRVFQLGRSFYAKWNCNSPNSLTKCTESSSTLSTNTSGEWNLYLFWSNHLVTPFSVKLILQALLKIKTKRVIPTDTKGIFHRSCLSSPC